MKTVSKKGIPEVGLEIRDVDGVDVLFTTDGKMLSNQVAGAGFIHTDTEKDGNGAVVRRSKTFRATFLVDNRNVTQQGPYVPSAETLDVR